MRELFTGWRRTIGWLMLLLACVLMGMWSRSLIFEDSWTKLGEGLGTTYFLASKNQEIVWAKQEGIIWGPDSAGYRSRKVSRGVIQKADDYKIRSRYNWMGFRVEQGVTYLEGDFISLQRISIRTIPYWSLTLPPSLLAAYLILWKPKKRGA